MARILSPGYKKDERGTDSQVGHVVDRRPDEEVELDRTEERLAGVPRSDVVVQRDGRDEANELNGETSKNTPAELIVREWRSVGMAGVGLPFEEVGGESPTVNLSTQSTGYP